MFQHRINTESYPVAQLCVNTLLATKVTLITDGIYFGTLRVKINKRSLNVVVLYNKHNLKKEQRQFDIRGVSMQRVDFNRNDGALFPHYSTVTSAASITVARQQFTSHKQLFFFKD
jgi:hypothetical protein